MSKVKSHKGLLKRVRITSRGKITHKRAGTSHLMSSFAGNKSRRLRRPLVGSTHAAKKIGKALNMRLIGRNQD
ncbi:MAG: 50S ribosomal protein L35 [Phycisphaeraceae bacterium]